MEKAIYHLHNYLQKVVSESQRAKRVAFGAIEIGDVVIRGFTVWESFDGRLNVSFPDRKKIGKRWEECVEVPEKLQHEIESGLIAEYERLSYHTDFDVDAEVFVRL